MGSVYYYLTDKKQQVELAHLTEGRLFARSFLGTPKKGNKMGEINIKKGRITKKQQVGIMANVIKNRDKIFFNKHFDVTKGRSGEEAAALELYGIGFRLKAVYLDYPRYEVSCNKACKLSLKERKEIFKLSKEGHSLSEIGRRFGVSHPTAKFWSMSEAERVKFRKDFYKSHPLTSRYSKKYIDEARSRYVKRKKKDKNYLKYLTDLQGRRDLEGRR